MPKISTKDGKNDTKNTISKSDKSDKKEQLGNVSKTKKLNKSDDSKSLNKKSDISLDSKSKVKKEKVSKINNKEDINIGSEILLTKEGFDKIKSELDYLKTEKRREVADRLREAISYGDLSENSEYEEAKNEQAFVEGRIVELEKKIKNAKIISDVHADIVNVGSTVEIQEVLSGNKSTYTIVGSTEAEPFQGRISNESPLGRAILGLKKGDTAKVIAPKGAIEYKILKIL